MSARHLVIGLDGADLDLVRELGSERLPHIWALMTRGAYAHLESVQPPATLPNWTTFLTGADPGVHGVFDFTTRRGYDVRFTAGTVREVPTIAARLDAMGLAVACLSFPATWPPERLRHGAFLSGWDAPVAFRSDRSFAWPPTLHDDIRARFGDLAFDDVDEFAADTPGWHGRLPDALCGRIARKTALAEWLMGDRSWDLFMIYFGESDTASHYLASLHDKASPRRPAHVSDADADGLARVYVALDEAVGALVSRAGSDVEVTLLSDHGSGASSDRVVYLNRALADAGLLRFRARSIGASAASSVKEAALRLLPPLVRDRAFRAAGTLLPSLVESRARFGAIDMGATAAFSDELNYFPGVWLNVRGREPSGTVDPRALDATRRLVTDALLALRDPWSERPVVSAVTPREDLFRGPHVDRAPNLLVTFALTETGHTYNLMPSRSGDGPVFRRLAREEYLGRKGRSLPGSHRPKGLFVAAGEAVTPVGEIDARIADVTATLLARMNVAVPADASGRVLFEILSSAAPTSPDVLPMAPRTAVPAHRESAVVQRLRALGYVE